MDQNSNLSIIASSNYSRDNEAGHKRHESERRVAGLQDQRKRISRACDRCRAQKDKCDGRRPTCSSCMIHGNKCTYEYVSRKRGLPEGYVRGLKKLWGLAVRQLPGIEDAVILMLNGGESNRNSDAAVDLWNDEESGDSLLETWNNCRISQEFDKLLPDLESKYPTGTKRKRRSMEAKQDVENALTPRSLIDPKFTSTAGNESAPAENSIAITETVSGPEISERNMNRFDSRLVIPHEYQEKRPSSGGPNSHDKIFSLELPPNASYLLETYMTHTNCWFPIMERYDAMKNFYRYLNMDGVTSNAFETSGDCAALWAIFAYAGYQQWKVQNIDENNSSHGQSGPNAERLYALAERLLTGSDLHFCFGHVQALLILALLQIGRGNWRAAWVLSGRATRVAIDLGLDMSAKSLDESGESQRKLGKNPHIVLGCVMIDTLVSAHLDRRPYWTRDDVNRIGRVEEDGLEEWEPWTGSSGLNKLSKSPKFALSTFNRLIFALQILNEVIQDRFCDILNQSSLNQLLDQAHRLSQGIPKDLQIDPNDSSNMINFSPPHFNLHVTLASTLLIIYSRLESMNNNMDKPGLINAVVMEARRIALLLNGFHQVATAFSIPPTLEYCTFIACRSLLNIKTKIDRLDKKISSWSGDFHFVLNSLQNSWPAFRESRNSLQTLLWKDDLQLFADPGLSNIQANQKSMETPQSILQSSTMSLGSQRAELVSMDKRLDGGHEQVENNFATRSKFDANPRQLSNDSNDFSNQGTIPTASQSTSISMFSVPLSETYQNMTQVQEVHPQVQGVGMSYSPERPFALSSDVFTQVDSQKASIFNEFGPVDAMQWFVDTCDSVFTEILILNRSDNWSQSLRNLGFTDADSLTQEWSQYCDEPDLSLTFIPMLDQNKNPPNPF